MVAFMSCGLRSARSVLPHFVLERISETQLLFVSNPSVHRVEVHLCHASQRLPLVLDAFDETETSYYGSTQFCQQLIAQWRATSSAVAGWTVLLQKGHQAILVWSGKMPPMDARWDVEYHMMDQPESAPQRFAIHFAQS